MSFTFSTRLLGIFTALAISIGLLGSAFIFSNAQAAGVIYVNASVSGGSDDGTSWADAYSDLQTALGSATAGDEIWVATGVYTPGASMDDSFQLVAGVAIYGGFAATETLRSERDWTNKVTVLSGDIDGDDVVDSNGVVATAANIAGKITAIRLSRGVG